MSPCGRVLCHSRKLGWLEHRGEPRPLLPGSVPPWMPVAMAAAPCPRCRDAQGPQGAWRCEQGGAVRERPGGCTPPARPQCSGPQVCFPSGSTGLGRWSSGPLGQSQPLGAAPSPHPQGRPLTRTRPSSDPQACRLPGATPGWGLPASGPSGSSWGILSSQGLGGPSL